MPLCGDHSVLQSHSMLPLCCLRVQLAVQETSASAHRPPLYFGTDWEPVPSWSWESRTSTVLQVDLFPLSRSNPPVKTPGSSSSRPSCVLNGEWELWFIFGADNGPLINRGHSLLHVELLQLFSLLPHHWLDASWVGRYKAGDWLSESGGGACGGKLSRPWTRSFVYILCQRAFRNWEGRLWRYQSVITYWIRQISYKD